LTEQEASQEKVSTRSTRGSYKAWRQREQIRLSTDPVFSQCEIYGSRQCCPVHKTLANGPCLLSYTPVRFMERSLFGTHRI